MRFTLILIVLWSLQSLVHLEELAKRLLSIPAAQKLLKGFHKIFENLLIFMTLFFQNQILQQICAGCFLAKFECSQSCSN